MSAQQTSQTNPKADGSKSAGVTKADKVAAADKAKAPVARTQPWQDLPAGQVELKEPRDKTVLACALKLLRERGREGATLLEIKESFKEVGLFHHDPKALLVWASKNRGFGFHMKKDGSEKIVLDMPKTEK